MRRAQRREVRDARRRQHAGAREPQRRVQADRVARVAAGERAERGRGPQQKHDRCVDAPEIRGLGHRLAQADLRDVEDRAHRAEQKLRERQQQHDDEQRPRGERDQQSRDAGQRLRADQRGADPDALGQTAGHHRAECRADAARDQRRAEQRRREAQRLRQIQNVDGHDRHAADVVQRSAQHQRPQHGIVRDAPQPFEYVRHDVRVARRRLWLVVADAADQRARDHERDHVDEDRDRRRQRLARARPAAPGPMVRDSEKLNWMRLFAATSRSRPTNAGR